MIERSGQFWPPPKRNVGTPPERSCDHPGCAGAGEFRAPKSRQRLRDYYWFCLDHVRSYNAAWDFCAGMSEGEIERMVRSDVTWQRPTWRLGNMRPDGRRFRTEWFADPFELFGEAKWTQRAKAAPETPEQRAMRVMGLAEPLSVTALKARYKELCKRHHPDTNGGDKAAEERFKRIGDAYRTLLATMTV